MTPDDRTEGRTRHLCKIFCLRTACAIFSREPENLEQLRTGVVVNTEWGVMMFAVPSAVGMAMGLCPGSRRSMPTQRRVIARRAHRRGLQPPRDINTVNHYLFWVLG